MRPILFYIILFILPAGAYCQQPIDSAKNKVDKVTLSYPGKGDSIWSNLQKVPTNYLDERKANVTKIISKEKKYSEKEKNVLDSVQELPGKYFKQVKNKVDKYSNRITSKTEKSLVKLCKWEKKIHNLLQKVNPDADKKLFGDGKRTFASVLQKMREGKSIVENYEVRYDHYRDQLNSSFKYLGEQENGLSEKFKKSAAETSAKLDKLEDDIKNTEAIQEFIKERKDQLINEAIKYIGKSRYLIKMNKEAYYYAETLRNYKDIFSDPGKIEALAIKLLSNIPEFKSFAANNSPLSGLFATSGSFPNLSAGATTPIVNGLAPRAALQQYIQTNIPSVNSTNFIQQFQSKLPVSPVQLDNLKNPIPKSGEAGSKSLPEFKPNTQKSKPFGKRLEKGIDLQFGKSVNFLPGTADVGLKIGYKLNDKSSAGIGVNYKLGFGHGWDNIRFSSEGIGFRTYLKWKLKKGLDIQGGSEWNYMLRFSKITELKNENAWQQSALLGLSKHYSIKKKLKGNVQFLYDFLYQSHIPHTQPLVFRFGYGL